MGQEANCTLHMGKTRSKGKALLETSELIFRPAAPGEKRLQIPFASMKGVKAAHGKLTVETPEGVAIFELGSVAPKWREKILHPKSRLEKLGVKADRIVSALGVQDEDFAQELRFLNRDFCETPRQDSDLIFLTVGAKAELHQIKKLSALIKKDGAIWVLYPKGQKHITEKDVLSAGRKAGLKDVKVVGFSPTHTALKFVIPVDKR
ncbi:MAG: hypothetical protein C5B56_14330 [Proteobacteria bacterium]|nr:MAG: hypothetical protein C5B56_14330 [Pseudomonadota bacterium]